MSPPGEDVYCTLLTTDGYLPGAQVLAHSLRDAGTSRKLAVLVTLDTLSAATIAELGKLYDYLLPVDRLRNRSPANLYLMDRGDLDSAFTKLQLWRQIQFRKIVYVDADVVALRAPDELFDLDADFAAAPDVGWPDCFNSGVMVLTPNMPDYHSLLALAQRSVSFDGADQGLLNIHFPNYHRISFRYNCTPSANYQYLPAYRHFQSEIALLHFIGKDKPWFVGNHVRAHGSVYEELLGRWWAVYDRHFKALVEERSDQPAAIEPGSGEQETPRHEADTVTKPWPASPLPPNDVPAPVSAVHEPSSPLYAEWDPSRSPPPVNSRPEAPHFPQQIYKMSRDPDLFRPPSTYPEPPKNLGYDMPKSPSSDVPLKAIFPWEATARKATRVFADDLPPPPSSPRSALSPRSDEENDTRATASSVTSPASPVVSPDPWSSYTVTNAWDVPEIEAFVSKMALRRRSGGPMAFSPSSADEVLSPGVRLRPSMKLTDFPTALERPSLPVTPAPVRRGPTFWGVEKNATGQLPTAADVPAPEDWDPLAKLEELSRRQSDVRPVFMPWARPAHPRAVLTTAKAVDPEPTALEATDLEPVEAVEAVIEEDVTAFPASDLEPVEAVTALQESDPEPQETVTALQASDPEPEVVTTLEAPDPELEEVVKPLEAADPEPEEVVATLEASDLESEAARSALAARDETTTSTEKVKLEVVERLPAAVRSSDNETAPKATEAVHGKLTAGRMSGSRSTVMLAT
ncbi:MAG: glycogenin glucosyltransferase [Phylliscum demangeonii]|nr:MAG: glycogenin glucosyltransferase [Phylliscum demangeonii]